jgi:hypothetical protein
MTSTVTAATMTVTLTETIILNGSDQGSTNTLTIASINEVMKRIVTCSASQTTTVAEFRNDVYEASGAIDIEDSRYIRITNLDDTNSVEIAVVTVGTTYQVKLDPGHSHILGSANDLMLAEADVTPSFGTMADVNSIRVRPGTSAVDIEVFVASI